ncbi:MAG: hypothetical protein FJ257_12575 [Phycisphaerae bacterium]|nr:hypothetical protein [Phycisphaerae bacterium]
MIREDFLPLVDEFLDLYPGRPVRANAGGMGINHCFGLFAVLRSRSPQLVVESGVWKGQSTWIIEQAVPAASIVCIDPRPDLREYSSKSAEYRTEDFAGIDWSQYPTSDAVCFFDDHQNEYSRLMELRWWGFRSAIFEDNFPVGEGDCYSLRHALAGVGHTEIQMSRAYRPTGRRRVVRRVEESVLRRYLWRQAMLRDPNIVDAAALRRNLALYLETPALALNPTNNWGGEWTGAYAIATKPIFADLTDSPRLAAILADLDAAGARRELEYGYMAFVELSETTAR